MDLRVTGKKLPVIRQLPGVEAQDASEALPAGEAPEDAPSEQAEQAEPTRVCRKCQCGTLVLRARKARPTVACLMPMPPHMEPESVGGDVQPYLPLTG